MPRDRSAGLLSGKGIRRDHSPTLLFSDASPEQPPAGPHSTHPEAHAKRALFPFNSLRTAAGGPRKVPTHMRVRGTQVQFWPTRYCQGKSSSNFSLSPVPPKPLLLSHVQRAAAGRRAVGIRTHSVLAASGPAAAAAARAAGPAGAGGRLDGANHALPLWCAPSRAWGKGLQIEVGCGGMGSRASRRCPDDWTGPKPPSLFGARLLGIVVKVYSFKAAVVTRAAGLAAAPTTGRSRSRPPTLVRVLSVQGIWAHTAGCRAARADDFQIVRGQLHLELYNLSCLHGVHRHSCQQTTSLEL